MKPIFNWDKATVFDLEGDGLLDEITKMHVLSFQMEGKDSVTSIKADPEGIERVKRMFMWHIDNEIPVVAHNGIGFDVKVLELLYKVDLSKLMVIDTLGLSWYLNTTRMRHGLDSFHEDYGIKKPEVTDWKNLSYEEYRHRCEEDVKINKALWEDLKHRLITMYTMAQTEIDLGNVGGTRMTKDEVIYLDQFKGDSVENAINRILTFLMFKMDCAALQETTGWSLDRQMVEASHAELTLELDAAKEELERVMPAVPKYVQKKEPAKMYKADGTLTVGGENWKKVMEDYNSNAKDELGTPKVILSDKEGYVKVLSTYDPPNSGSVSQIKDFLFSFGWVPRTFKYVKDKEAFDLWNKQRPPPGSPKSVWKLWKDSKPEERRVPQVTVGGEDGKELCESVLELAEEFPEIHVYAKFGVLRHRISILNGFLEQERGGKVQARIAGFTNTLRVKHAGVVNLPGVDKPYGEVIRGSLIAGPGRVSCGSDMSSLEDRTKHHFMLPLDPDYVATMQAPDYDPHITMALTAKMITQEEFDQFMADKNSVGANVKLARKKGKTTNYASVYNAGAAAIARAAGVSEEEGKILHTAYWELNWAVKAIAEEQVVIECCGGKWLINPINGFCYSLRKDSDRFSTLCQGTGSYFFDMWTDDILEQQQAKWGRKTLTACFHDENVFVHKDTPLLRETFKSMIANSITVINERYKLRRELGCETQFGQRYSDIH